MTLPWWVPWFVALISTMWLMWVSWPRPHSSYERTIIKDEPNKATGPLSQNDISFEKLLFSGHFQINKMKLKSDMVIEITFNCIKRKW